MNSSRIKENNSSWWKSEYEITNIDGIEFIVQMKGGGRSEYDPLKYKIPKKRPEVQSGQLEIAPHIAFSRINPDNHEEILQFANTWGLLGLRKTTTYSDINTVSEIFDKHNVAIEIHKIDDLYKNKNKPQGERDREPVIVFQEAIRKYKELINKIGNEYKDVGFKKGFRSKKELNKYMNEMIRIEDKTRNVPKKHKKRVEDIFTKKGQTLIPFLHLNEILKDVHPQVFPDIVNHSISKGWRFDSLLSAIYLRLTMDWEEGKEFIECTWRKCNRLFIPNRKDNQHCSDSCHNNDKTDRANQRKWLEEALSEFNSHSQSKIEQLFNSLIEAGYSGKVSILDEIRKRLY
ncbi:hypothetical protein [Virgibacillus litoralis]|uniref:C2H2-type domain-containing protein n=1 Tax=Virgibacillus litoralis TaxID=578221 RepID=A0ABS4HGJ2_9BACI|nr:hypothetical protein [Virgibacillus litoralis]MBP1950041.1 hypothetical protein [Virgibacillus litoralis]